MRRILRAAFRGIRAELAAGESGWEVVSGGTLPLSGFGLASDAGAIVSSESVMGLSSVWACTSATSQLVSSLPCHLFERQRDGGKVRIEDDLLEVVTRRPNSVQTGVEYWEGMVTQQLLRGNAFAEKLAIAGRLVALRPLLNVTPKWNGSGFDYHVAETGKVRVLKASDVLHLRGFGAGDGLGLSAVRYGVQSFGAALAADQSAAKVFSNAMMPSGVLEADQVLNAAQRDQLQTMLSDYVGSSLAGKTLVLENGLKWNKVQWDPEDVQLLETRRFNVEDICRWFGIPPIIIGHASDGQTMWGTGVESIMLSWLQTGINPLLRRLEARMNVDLIPPARRGKWFFEFNREAMLQMDSKAKGDFLQKMKGTMTANERRDKLNLPPHSDPAADKLLDQTAQAPIDTLGGQT